MKKAKELPKELKDMPNPKLAKTLLQAALMSKAVKKKWYNHWHSA